MDEGRTRDHSEHVEILTRVRKNDTRGATKALREPLLMTGQS